MKSSKPRAKPIGPALFSKGKPVPSSNGLTVKLVAPEARCVGVAGTFNNWQPAATLLKVSRAGEWKGELTLPPGRYEYLFVVDGKWTPDPTACEAVPNPFGGVNSVVSVA